MATVEDLVKASGYSRSTAFRLLAGKPVRPAAREALLAAARAIGYPLGAPGPRGDCAAVLSVPAGFADFRGYAEVVAGVMQRAAELGLPAVFAADQAAGRRYGVIVLGKRQAEEDAERAGLARRGVPCVLVNRKIDEDGASWAGVDFRRAAADAVARLAAAGCRRIGCWSDAADRRAELHKLEGFRAAAASAGIAAVVLGPADGDPEAAAAAALAGPAACDGWFAPSDELAMRLVRTAAGLGRRVPEDLALVSCNDVAEAAWFRPALTAVHIPFRACGAAAVDAVVRLLDRPLERSVKILLSHRIAERESCAAPRSPS
jgi:LacI family transcriptional regulator